MVPRPPVTSASCCATYVQLPAAADRDCCPSQASAISLGHAVVSGLGPACIASPLGLLIANGFQYLLSGAYWISFFLCRCCSPVAINLVAGPVARCAEQPPPKTQ
jgi:hypothetical protein